MVRGEGSDETPSRRHSGRPVVVTYRVRVDLEGTSPPLWRRLELASDLYLDEVHAVIQAAFGWTDSHLHRFGSGPDYYSRDTEYYLCPFEVAEGETGVPEDEVRLDEVLYGVGGGLFYCYDFGDDWQHVIRLEAVLPRGVSAPRAACTAGCRPGPAEDCGGVYGYELICAAIDPEHPGHKAAVGEFGRFYGNDIHPSAALAEPADVDAATAARMVRPYTWLLHRVGADGIMLTGAGYLPPAHVAAATAELGLGEEWIGKGNRENQTMPVLHLRESATRMGLLRKHRGRLLRTARGRAAATDPLALWWQLAERMPLRSADACETQAGLILLAAVAAQFTGDLDAAVARREPARLGGRLAFTGIGRSWFRGRVRPALWFVDHVLAQPGWLGTEGAVSASRS